VDDEFDAVVPTVSAQIKNSEPSHLIKITGSQPRSSNRLRLAKRDILNYYDAAYYAELEGSSALYDLKKKKQLPKCITQGTTTKILREGIDLWRFYEFDTNWADNLLIPLSQLTESISNPISQGLISKLHHELLIPNFIYKDADNLKNEVYLKPLEAWLNLFLLIRKKDIKSIEMYEEFIPKQDVNEFLNAINIDLPSSRLNKLPKYFYKHTVDGYLYSKNLLSRDALLSFSSDAIPSEEDVCIDILNLDENINPAIIELHLLKLLPNHIYNEYESTLINKGALESWLGCSEIRIPIGRELHKDRNVTSPTRKNNLRHKKSDVQRKENETAFEENKNNNGIGIILFGPQGSGKAELAQKISKEYTIPVITQRSVVDTAAAEDSELGKLAREARDSSRVSEDLLTALLRVQLPKMDLKKGYIIVDIPKSLEQARNIDQTLSALGRPVDLAIKLKVDTDDLIERLVGHIQCDKCGTSYNNYVNPPMIKGVCDVCGARCAQPPGDYEENISNRIRLYDMAMVPLLDFYEKAEKLSTFDATIGGENLWSRVKKVINATPSSEIELVKVEEAASDEPAALEDAIKTASTKLAKAAPIALKDEVHPENVIPEIQHLRYVIKNLNLKLESKEAEISLLIKSKAQLKTKLKAFRNKKPSEEKLTQANPEEKIRLQAEWIELLEKDNKKLARKASQIKEEAPPPLAQSDAEKLIAHQQSRINWLEKEILRLKEKINAGEESKGSIIKKLLGK